MNSYLENLPSITGNLGDSIIIFNEYVLKPTKIEGGTRLTISRDNEVQTIDIMDGLTPKKGVDYWTDSDKEEFKSAAGKAALAAISVDATLNESGKPADSAAVGTAIDHVKQAVNSMIANGTNIPADSQPNQQLVTDCDGNVGWQDRTHYSHISVMDILPECSMIYAGDSVGIVTQDFQGTPIIDEIYASGYPDKMILQEFIPGGDASMRVFTAFSDCEGNVRAMCLGHTMVEEHTPKGLGNHASIVTEDTELFPLTSKIKSLLEDLRYTGFSNFDIKYTGSGDDFRVFEINLRQGRSNMYMTAAGINIAKLAVEIYNNPGDECVLCKNEHFWHHVPKSVAYTYTEDPALVEKARSLAKMGNETSSLWYKSDIFKNPLRFICVVEQLRRQKKKFQIYYPKK